ncbi:MAG TPA: head GIN domain-containing protein [Nitrososphaera sp.]|nr:head GIN domain-containing protein [Nitrososphaera sp.]
MKKTMLSMSPLVLMALVAGCHLGMDRVSGSGNRQKQKRDVASFNSIATNGAFEINVTCQRPVSLEIEGDDNILPLVVTEISNSVLHIKNLRNYSVSDPIRLQISVPNLEGVTVNGAGKMEVSGIKNEKFEIDANGAPTIRVSGETKVVNIDTNGAGKIDTGKLRASKAIVDSKGVSRVDVQAADQLDVTVSGPSHVTYEGNPVVNKTVNGPGSVEKKASVGS